MKIYVAVSTYQDCNEVEVRTFESKKDAQEYVVKAYIEDSEYWSKPLIQEGVDRFRRDLEADGYVHVDWTVDYSIYETVLQFEKGSER